MLAVRPASSFDLALQDACSLPRRGVVKAGVEGFHALSALAAGGYAIGSGLVRWPYLMPGWSCAVGFLAGG